MSDSGTQGTSWDRNRSNNPTGVEPEGRSAETWNTAEDTFMAATSGTGSASTVNASAVGDASISQKMVSATCGSVLTGLLGRQLDLLSLHGFQYLREYELTAFQ